MSNTRQQARGNEGTGRDTDPPARLRQPTNRFIRGTVMVRSNGPDLRWGFVPAVRLPEVVGPRRGRPGTPPTARWNTADGFPHLPQRIIVSSAKTEKPELHRIIELRTHRFCGGGCFPIRGDT